MRLFEIFWLTALIPKLVKSLPFYIPEVWIRCPFQAEPPRIGHCREYPSHPEIYVLALLLCWLTNEPLLNGGSSEKEVLLISDLWLLLLAKFSCNLSACLFSSHRWQTFLQQEVAWSQPTSLSVPVQGNWRSRKLRILVSRATCPT